MLSLDHPLGLGGSETRVGKHPDLRSDVAPVPWGPELLQPLPQALPHVDDPVSHSLDAVAPLLVQGRVFYDSIHYPAAVGWRVGVHGTDDQGHLGPTMLYIDCVLDFT